MIPGTGIIRLAGGKGMNRSITQKFLLVIVLVTLMGAGAMSSAGNLVPSSGQSQPSNDTAYIIGSAGTNSGVNQPNPLTLCHEERQSRIATASQANITGRNMH